MTPPISVLPHFQAAVIFTGHMIDLASRHHPRFPPTMEKLAADKIYAQIAEFSARCDGTLVGIASAARGGDILFHEACSRLDVPTVLVLPFGVEEFLERSVRGVKCGNWEARFTVLWNRLPSEARIILEGGHDSDPFGTCNRAMLSLALRIGAKIKLLALWDGSDTGKPGGTAAFVEEVRSIGGCVSHLDSRSLLAAS